MRLSCQVAAGGLTRCWGLFWPMALVALKRGLRCDAYQLSPIQRIRFFQNHYPKRCFVQKVINSQSRLSAAWLLPECVLGTFSGTEAWNAGAARTGVCVVLTCSLGKAGWESGGWTFALFSQPLASAQSEETALLRGCPDTVVVLENAVQLTLTRSSSIFRGWQRSIIVNV